MEEMETNPFFSEMFLEKELEMAVGHGSQANSRKDEKKVFDYLIFFLENSVHLCMLPSDKIPLVTRKNRRKMGSSQPELPAHPTLVDLTFINQTDTLPEYAWVAWKHI